MGSILCTAKFSKTCPVKLTKSSRGLNLMTVSAGHWAPSSLPGILLTLSPNFSLSQAVQELFHFTFINSQPPKYFIVTLKLRTVLY